MILTKKQIKEFEELSKPVIEFLNNNCNPHARVIVDCGSAEILSGSATIRTEEYFTD